MIRAMMLAAAATALAAPTLPAPWADEFTTGAPDPTIWHDCAGPYLNAAQQCSAAQSGPGEQVYWNPTLFGAGVGAPTIAPVKGAGQFVIYASRLDPKDKVAIAASLVKQGLTGKAQWLNLVNPMLNAGWKSRWLESTKQVLPGQTVTVAFLPGSSPSYWGGPWGFDHVPGHPYFEVDLAETTFNADGTMNVRQNLHAGAATNTVSCGTPSMKRQWLYPSATLSADGKALTFRLNGKVSCTIPLTVASTGFNVILSQQVGGLAAATTAASAPMTSQYDYVRVTTP